jgi:hypothetical protein
MKKLHDTYLRLEKILGDNIESLDSVQLVETYRRYWKPEKVKTILLAESHVYTSDDDRSISIPTLPLLPGYPAQYARFVYCIGYGERMLTKSRIHPKRDGTPQFWKIFYSCNSHVSSPHDFRPILSQTDFEQRILNKIQLLQDLKAKGVWLVDTSIVALYKRGKKIPHMFSALETSWNLYTRDIVTAAAPDHIICIGKGVASIVESDLKTIFGDRHTVIHQPNAFLSSEKHMSNYQKYADICCR